jgi:small subunit ribosomal protein S16
MDEPKEGATTLKKKAQEKLAAKANPVVVSEPEAIAEVSEVPAEVVETEVVIETPEAPSEAAAE